MVESVGRPERRLRCWSGFLFSRCFFFGTWNLWRKWERARRLLERLVLRILLMSGMMFTGGSWRTGTMQRSIRVSASSWMRISVDYRRGDFPENGIVQQIQSFILSYALDVNLNRVEDVLLHRKILSDARKPNKRPVIHVRFVEVSVIYKHITTRLDSEDIPEQCVKDVSCTSGCNCAEPEEGVKSNRRKREVVFEPCSKLEDLNLDTRQCLQNGDGRFPTGTHTGSREAADVLIHEIIFSTLDKPKLLSQLSALLSDIGLNIREAHVFSTTDGYSLDVFVVDGWPVEDMCRADTFLTNAMMWPGRRWPAESTGASCSWK